MVEGERGKMANINMKLPDSIEQRLANIVNIKLLDYVEEVIDEKELEQIVKEQIRKYSHNIVRQVLDSPDTKSKLCQKIYPALEQILNIELINSAKEN